MRSSSPPTRPKPDAWSRIHNARTRPLLAKVRDPVEELAVRLKTKLDERVIGQAAAKAQIVRAVSTLLNPFDETRWRTIAIAAPECSGSTSLVRGVAEALNGDANAYVLIDGAHIRDSMALKKYVTGVEPYYMGYENPDRRSPLAPTQMEARFGGKERVLIGFEDTGRIGTPTAPTTIRRRRFGTLQHERSKHRP